ncbi:transposase IS4 family protein, partial [mine drainage metagenome]
SYDDWLVEMGGSQAGTSPVPLRWVRIWGPGFDRTLITNVLEPERLTPEQMMAAYRRRWSVERMYLAMKEVLELNHLYNCSPAAVGQQVYATAILYNTLRTSQGANRRHRRGGAGDLVGRQTLPHLDRPLPPGDLLRPGLRVRMGA